jgi:hypothetical protein
VNAHDAICKAAHDALCKIRTPHIAHVWFSPVPYFDYVADTIEAAVSAAGYTITLTDDGAGSGEPAVAAGEAGSIPAGNPAPSSPHMEPVAERIATIIEEYADDLQPPTTVEWLELRDWFKDLLHEVAAKAREIGEGATPAIDREQIAERLAEAMADSWMGDEVDCADVATILTPAVAALIEGAQ